MYEEKFRGIKKCHGEHNMDLDTRTWSTPIRAFLVVFMSF
jgi:hypothetical protein